MVAYSTAHDPLSLDIDPVESKTTQVIDKNFYQDTSSKSHLDRRPYNYETIHKTCVITESPIPAHTSLHSRPQSYEHLKQPSTAVLRNDLPPPRPIALPNPPLNYSIINPAALFPGPSGLSQRSYSSDGCDQADAICAICNYQAQNRSKLELHMRTHSGERPYPCHLCNYSATSKWNLNSHLRTHSQETKFKCDHCDFKAKHKGSLTYHLSSKHPDLLDRGCSLSS